MPPEDEPGRDLGTASKLLIAYKYGDDGDRQKKGIRFWASPYIHVSTEDPITGLVPPGVPATISVDVQNLSKVAPAMNVIATFYVAEPSIGGLTNIVPIGDDPQHRTILPGLAETFVCGTPFVPSLADGTHQCLLVQAAGINDGVTVPWRADLDRHVGQKNLTVATAGEQQMKLTVSNPFTSEKLTTVAVRTWRVRGLTCELATSLGAGPWGLLAHAGTATVDDVLAARGAEVEPGDAGGIAFEAFGDEGPFEPLDEAAQHQLRERRDDRPEGTVVAEAVMAPASQRRVIFNFTSVQQPGQWAYVHQLTQRIDDVEIGGYTIVENPAH